MTYNYFHFFKKITCKLLKLWQIDFMNNSNTSVSNISNISNSHTTMTTYAASLIPALEAEHADNVAQVAALKRDVCMLSKGIPHVKGEIVRRQLTATLAEKRALLETLEYAVEYFNRVGVEYIAECEARSE